MFGDGRSRRVNSLRVKSRVPHKRHMLEQLHFQPTEYATTHHRVRLANTQPTQRLIYDFFRPRTSSLHQPLTMADPFEVRMRFTSQLQHLNASTASAIKAANYALKYAEFSDDLHSCILEQLERNNMNNRANIMYFLPALCDTAKAHSEPAYVRMMERDILRIIDLVAPDDGSGAANVKVVRKVLAQLQQKAFLMPQTVTELEECISSRDGANGEPSSPPTAASMAAAAVGGESGNLDGSVSAARSTPHSTTGAKDQPVGTGIRLDKRQIEQRIEEDRERHKRAREGIWAIPQQTGNPALADDAEFEKMWDEISDVGEDDFVRAREESEERRRCLEFEEV
ncbi:CTD kinase subunit gamma CTK3-domain-containing protein [Acrodontium crateriforme]|uniref:CTD kinase subunit gamma CTK3-domain-containing protein n=1 Tax=Acrodontium crateriforme TaxID=150365 RepID=A0AAQ3M7U8_9PEZI|nr:CTD kinase subunit gamma CTK3-domain-containing protein [Acrodontium crateriforme]